jgi:hypothetical protein
VPTLFEFWTIVEFANAARQERLMLNN